MIDRYNRNQIFRAILALIGSLFCTGLAICFFGMY